MDRTVTHFFARIGPLTGTPTTRHTMRRGTGPEELLPQPDVLVLELTSDAGAMLFRYTASGDFGGDTWHAQREDAEQQARFEYGERLGDWRPVPADQSDAADYAVRQVSSQ